MRSLVDLKMLKQLSSPPATAGAFSPPHAVLESPDHYSIYLNLLGIERKDIAVGLDERKRELTVLVRREREAVRTGFYWMFGLPKSGTLANIRMRYRNGAVEIRIPKAA